MSTLTGRVSGEPYDEVTFEVIDEDMPRSLSAEALRYLALVGKRRERRRRRTGSQERVQSWPILCKAYSCLPQIHTLGGRSFCTL